MQCAEAEGAAKGAGTAPVPGRGDCYGAGDAVFVVVDKEAKRAFEELGEVSNDGSGPQEGKQRTSSTSSGNPDSPRTIPSGLPMM